jgi:hypothetical protein
VSAGNGAQSSVSEVITVSHSAASPSLTITQISTGKTIGTGLVDMSGTGSFTYSDGTTTAIASWTVAD